MIVKYFTVSCRKIGPTVLSSWNLVHISFVWWLEDDRGEESALQMKEFSGDWEKKHSVEKSSITVSPKYLQLVYSDKTWLHTLFTRNSNTEVFSLYFHLWWRCCKFSPILVQLNNLQYWNHLHCLDKKIV